MKIIAESAYNHQGDFEYLKQLAVAAKKSNTDYFTVQMMNVDSFCTKDYSKYKLYKDTEFSESQWIEIFNYCKSIEIDVIPCTLEEKSFDIAYNYGYRLFKIHGTDLINKKFLEYINLKEDAKFILETQCLTELEIDFAVSILGNKVECIFHGFNNYPTEINEHNLLALKYLKEKHPCKIGYADHSLDTATIPAMAMVLGCDYLEKHITLSRADRHFDYQVSLEPDEFQALVSNTRHYSKAIGKAVKYPIESEKKYRDIILKKRMPDGTFLRQNTGKTYFESEIDSFEKKNISAAIIARLKSQRLKQKVLLPFAGEELLSYLYNRIKNETNSVKHVELATSYLPEDKPLMDLFQSKGYASYAGHPYSVIDRLLQVAMKNKSTAVFRITGDNPLTDPYLADEMVEIFVQNDVDYVRANNVPFGTSAELFKTKYLWDLYLKMEDPFVSEYLSWFVLKDETCKKAAIELKGQPDFVKYVNLSIDYPEDYEYATTVLNLVNSNKPYSIKLKDIIENINDQHIVDVNKYIKLPNHTQILYSDYLNFIENTKYIYKKEISLV